MTAVPVDWVVDRQSRKSSLTPVPAQRRKRPRVVYALMALAGAALIGGAQIVLGVLITQDSFALAAVNAQQRELTLQTQVLREDLAGISSPQNLAARASDLGLVASGTTAYMRLSDGAVTGVAEASGFMSSVSPNGDVTVGNALLDRQLLLAQGAAVAESIPPATADDATAEPEALPGPPPITDGLPSPATH